MIIRIDGKYIYSIRWWSYLHKRNILSSQIQQGSKHELKRICPLFRWIYSNSHLRFAGWLIYYRLHIKLQVRASFNEMSSHTSSIIHLTDAMHLRTTCDFCGIMALAAWIPETLHYPPWKHSTWKVGLGQRSGFLLGPFRLFSGASRLFWGG